MILFFYKVSLMRSVADFLKKSIFSLSKGVSGFALENFYFFFLNIGRDNFFYPDSQPTEVAGRS